VPNTILLNRKYRTNSPLMTAMNDVAPSQQKFLAQLAATLSVRLRSSLGWTGNPEQEQAAIRIVILTSVLIYLLLNEPGPTGNQLLWSSSLNFIEVLLVLSFAIYASTILWSGQFHARKIIAILVDSIGQSYSLYLTGPIGAPWYGLYLWIILGNGFRYGEKYLYLSTAIALSGFSCVALYTPFWLTHSELAIGLAFTLVLIPAYCALLIRRLNEARQRADAASRAKSDFLSCMSHEIRTPLNGILGMTDLLRLRPLSTDDKDCVETIHVSAHALARQINEILDLSKIEAGRMTIEAVDFDLYVLVNTTMRIFQTQALERGLTLNTIIDPATPYLLSGDPHKIRQVITNLVANALKFTDRGYITLRISPISSDEDITLLRFEVTDTGTGIPANKLQDIFDPFTQADDSISRNYGGTGLGTTICKNLVELMGGSIGLDSSLNVGTTFWFEIPFQAHKDSAGVTVRNWTSRCRVIYLSPIIHGNDPILNTLANWGVQYEPYTSVEEAHAKAISSNSYDALIINDMPASPLLTKIVEDADEVHPPRVQIVLLNSAQKLDLQQHKRKSLFALNTPLEQNLLLNVLHACYSNHGTEDEIVHFANAQSRATRVDRRLNVLVSDDNVTNRIVLQRMLDRLGHRHTIVSGGEATLLALENETFDAVIIDKNMPDMGGLEVYQAYCFAHGGASPVEFAILTADATAEAKANCTAAGINHFLTKPVSLTRLIEILSDMCGATPEPGKKSKPLLDATPDYIESAEIFDEAEFNKLAEIAGNDFSFLREVVNNFVDDTNKNIRGLEAAVAKNDWLGFCDLAHAVKGSSRYLGLTQIFLLAKEAQSLSQKDFKDRGIGSIVAIRKAADAAFMLLNKRLTDYSKKEATG
jgi:two-component system sensor histidine kinase RpfC